MNIATKENNNDIAVNQLHQLRRFNVAVPSAHFKSNMDVKDYIEKFGISKKELSERSGIDYRRITNCTGKGNYRFTDEETTKIKDTLVQLVLEMNKELLKNVK